MKKKRCVTCNKLSDKKFCSVACEQAMTDLSTRATQAATNDLDDWAVAAKKFINPE